MLAITGGKGGSGKSTTALGLGRALAVAGADPLVVDADTDLPDLHLLADVDREPTWNSLCEAPLECVAQRAPALGGVAVLPAGDEGALPGVFAQVTAWHGPILVDCPAGMGPDATRPLRRADRSILVTRQRAESLTDAAKTARVARRLDAPPAAALVLAGSGVETLPFDCPHVESVPSVDIHSPGERAVDAVLSHPGVRSAHRRVADVVRWPGAVRE
jgi:septum site-determining protein MinD